MSKDGSIFSQRIVVADFYLEKPLAGLDVCYSEFRGREIKRVPVIRIFGSNTNGQKTCMHVHGVYPYFYIPYEEKSFESVNKAIYQIAMNLDKAINISLGHSNSQTQHVFKIQLVKGIPFYGYHRSEHQFLKIYMLNPRFVRRAANLLQNGAIMDKQFLPHESHVPYILQFMIDYNLYGMSFLHVPLETVKFRVNDEQDVIPFKGILPAQILDCKLIRKLSVSCLEVDIAAGFILNRFQLIMKANAMHTNPGIESIWNDEQLRRDQMIAVFHANNEEEQIHQIPALEVPMADERNEMSLTTTELHYHSVLKSKLLEAEILSLQNGTSSEQTLSGESEPTQPTNNTFSTNMLAQRPNSRFNLTKLLQNAVYPQECSQTDQLLNASHVEDHLSVQSFFESNLSGMNASSDVEDTAVIDEQFVLSLSQKHVPLNHTMRDEDLELLNVLQELEENHDADQIDLDSTLAPLTQSHIFDLSPKSLDKEVLNKTLTSSDMKNEEENDEDNVHDFSVALENLDDILINLTQNKHMQGVQADSIAQFDGTDDLNAASIPSKSKTPPRTPTKRSRRQSLVTSPSKPSPKRSPRTPKTIHKFAALPLTVTNRSTKMLGEILSESGSCVPSTSNQNLASNTKLNFEEEKAINTSSNHKSGVKLTTTAKDNNKRIHRRRNNRLDKTHVTCSLTPLRRSQRSTNKLKFYDITDKSNIASEQNDIKTNVTERILDEDKPSTSNGLANTCESEDYERLKESVMKLSKVINLNRFQRRRNAKSTPTYKTPQVSESCKQQIEANFSNVRNKNLTKAVSPNNSCDKNFSENNEHLPGITNASEDEMDDDIDSFYEESAIFNSPSLFSNDSNSSFAIGKPPTPPDNAAFIITPIEEPPSHADALDYCKQMRLPEYEFPRPFYGNPDDVHKGKEVGNMLLRIPGNKLIDLEEYAGIMGADIHGLRQWRLQKFRELTDNSMHRKTQKIREIFASNHCVVITPFEQPPTQIEGKLWLKARELLQNANGSNDTKGFLTTDGDSPIQIRRQKLSLVPVVSDEKADDPECSFNLTHCSLSLTPMTPMTPESQETPTSSRVKQISKSQQRIDRKRLDRRLLKRVCLNAKLQAAVGVEDDDSKSALSPGSESNATSESSINTEIVMKEMERSSFLRQLQDVDQNCSLSNSLFDCTFGYKVALENLRQAKSSVEFTYLTIMCLEVFACTRGNLLPNPELDEISCLFYAIENSIPTAPADDADVVTSLPSHCCGYIIVQDGDATSTCGMFGIDSNVEVTIVNKEVEAFDALICICSKWDPDIYAGYETEMSSWGYVIDRAKHLCFNIAPLLSRVPTQKVRDIVEEDRDEQLTDLDVEMRLCGRILLDVWRLMRSEIALTSYSFENVVYHVLHKRCPHHSHAALTDWYVFPSTRWIVLEYYLERVRGVLDILEQLDLIGRTSEMAKLIGIQFYEVLSRGSQFRVESMMLRIAKPKNLVAVSPSVQQRANMRAPEFLPLIMEPSSRFYADPMIVLDFQSLYPSVIIAYNYCFSTCLGRVEHLGQRTPFEFGATQLRVSPKLISKLLELDLVTISPCGVVFVKSSVREGILPRLLKEILNTRQMVKQSMKLHKTNSALQRILHSRQLALKLMANVTYGYTAANFSGRMPAVEVGDSVVAKARECLDRAIRLVIANTKWNVQVVYGDTDSLFVLVPGRRRDEAFLIGEEIAAAITKENPYPMKLKLEKVYQPCILQTKKRYVGYMYETVDQTEPVYEAKGIETVRRDGCPLVSKMLEKVLRLLFETSDVSKVKSYVCKQFTKLLSGQANLQDLIFAKEFRGVNGYKSNACVPALELTKKWKQSDPRRIPRRGERVPFVIINGPPGVPLIRLVRHPLEVVQSKGLHINAIYYITKAIIPPLNRCLLLIGADVSDWFAKLPRKLLLPATMSTNNESIFPCSKKSTISQFFSSTNCVTDCGRQAQQHGICATCCNDKQRTLLILQMKMSDIESAFITTHQICQACCGRTEDLRCDSLDCPVFYVLTNRRRDLQTFLHLRRLVNEHV